jgi:putative PEP-CTERM system histidine kinase
MNSILPFNILPLANLFLLGVLLLYLGAKLRTHSTVRYLLVAMLPLIVFEYGSHLFVTLSNSYRGAALIALGVALVPIGFTPLSRTLGRSPDVKRSTGWVIYYLLQTLFVALFVREISNGVLIEWVTGILEQPVIIVEKTRRFLFLNTLLSGVLALFCFDKTLRNANKPQSEALRFVFIAFLGFIVYFCYLSFNVLTSSYISESMLHSGSAIIFLGLVFLWYALARHPFWEVKILVSRRIVFGCLSFTAAIIYLLISGIILDLLHILQPHGYKTLLPVAVFALVAVFLIIYLSPSFRKTAESFVTRHFFKNKYDYRDLWMKFSEKSSGTLNIKDMLPRVAEFIADAMFVRQVVIWLRSATSESLSLAYCHEPISADTFELPSLRLIHELTADDFNSAHALPENGLAAEKKLPVENPEVLARIGVRRFVLVEKDNEVLAVLGIGAELGGKKSSTEDDQLLLSVSNQVAHLILTHKLSEELLLSREWESFNRFASFIIHDLKNLATLQGMTLENAKRLGSNPEFLVDAFATFSQTTEKMINLIAGLSVQRGQFSLKQQPVNILEVIANTCDDLRLDQRAGVKVIKTFPPKEKVPTISGDPDLLRKAFTNLLLNAIQSLPKGKGAVEVTVSQPANGKITTEIRDTGCGIPPEQLQSLFRPFQTTKQHGMGIGLCHTRSIIEVHGGQIRIESRVNTGTKVELEFPTL